MSDDFVRTTRERISAVITRHHTGSDGKWIQCDCDKGWRGLEQWSQHVTDEVLSVILDMALLNAWERD